MGKFIDIGLLSLTFGFLLGYLFGVGVYIAKDKYRLKRNMNLYEKERKRVTQHIIQHGLETGRIKNGPLGPVYKENTIRDNKEAHRENNRTQNGNT